MKIFKKKYFFIFLTIFVSTLIHVLFIYFGKDTADISLMRQSGEMFLNGINVYEKANFYIYPPLTVFLEALSVYTAKFLFLDFQHLYKTIILIFDLLLTLLLVKYLEKTYKYKKDNLFWILLYILNPVIIIVSAAHGQIEAITSFFLVLSIYLFLVKNKRNFSAIVLGLSILTKPNPIIIIPLFVITGRLTLKQSIKFITLSVLPWVISMLPFLFSEPLVVLKKSLGYQGVNDFGLAAVFRALYYQKNAEIWLPLSSEITALSKYLYISSCILIYIIFYKRNMLLKSILAIFLAYTIFYYGVSAQHLLWIIPIGIILKEKNTFIYSLYVLISYMGFYTFFGPDILFGNLISFRPNQSIYMTIYFIGNILVTVYAIRWFVQLIRGAYKNVSIFKGININTKKVLIIFLPVVIVVSVLYLRKIAELVFIYLL